MAVLDILPECVSSVYFMYYNKWERFSLGKVFILMTVQTMGDLHLLDQRSARGCFSTRDT